MPVFDNTDGKKKPVAANAVAGFFKARKINVVAKEIKPATIEAPTKKAASPAPEKEKGTDK